MTILLTGITGYAGSAIAAGLREAQHRVIGVSRQASDDPNRLQADLLDAEQTKQAFSGLPQLDAVVHAAVTPHSFNQDFGSGARWGDAEIARNLVEALRGCAGGWSVPFVHLSSVCVYGRAVFQQPVRVDTEPEPASAYDRSKLAAEEVLREAALERLTILRVAPVFSADRMRNVEVRIRLPLLRLPMRVIPKTRMSLCPLDVLVNKVRRAVEVRSPGIQIQHVSARKVFTQKELLTLYGIASGVPIPEICLRPLFHALRLLPRGRELQCLYWKLLRDTVYEP